MTAVIFLDIDGPLLPEEPHLQRAHELLGLT